MSKSKVSELKFTFSILIINDASTEQQFIYAPNQENLDFIKIINMKENKGHARCIATGLKHIFENEEFDYVIPMDGDGEDRPEELNLIFKKLNENPSKTVTADRIKRSEGYLFKFMYEFHKTLTYVFTGKLIRFGNYGCLPKNDDGLCQEGLCHDQCRIPPDWRNAVSSLHRRRQVRGALVASSCQRVSR